MASIDVPVLGMTCAACVRRVEKAVGAVAGVAGAEVNLPLSRARLAIDRAAGRSEGDVLAAAAAAIRDAGYEVPADALEATSTGAARLAAIEHAEAGEARGLRRDAIAAIVLTAPLVALAMAGIGGTAALAAQLALGTAVVLGAGRRYFRLGFAAARHLAPDMNTLIALGAGAAWLSSAIVAVRWLVAPRGAAPATYFEAGAAIVAFVMIGKLLEARARARVSGAVRGLIALAPSRARRRAGSAADQMDDEIDAAALAPGDVMLVRPGERLAADGTVVEGSSAIDEALLTGESLPVDKTEGSPVYAGTLNQHGALAVRVARAGEQTALARIARAVEDAQGAKAPIARLADRVAAWFVPAVLAIAAVTAIGWMVAGSPGAIALERAIAVLVIACPCALGLATPAAVAVATARGAELGILFSGGDALERASKLDVACLDKTGTLTAGTPTVINVDQLSTTSINQSNQDEMLRLAASAEQASEHPLARAIVAAARARGLALESPTGAAAEPGGGVSARVAGHDVRVGTRSFTRTPEDLPAPAADHATIAFVSIDGATAGAIAIADPPAPAARAALDALRALAIEPVMITGDRAGAAAWIAGELGIERYHADVRPTAKAAIVAGERARGRRVAMVGDGLNDAPALAAADVGIAIGSGTDVTAAAADVTLLRGGIATLPAALGLARAALRTIRRNLIAAFAYNAVCIPIAAAGLLSPMLAAAAMSLSSVSVLASSLALRRYAR